MADATSTITVDTTTAHTDSAEWVYIDSTGVPHTVTEAETFTMLVSDDGAADVQYNFVVGQTLATDDGYVLTFRPRSGSQIAVLTDAGQGSAFYGARGEMSISCSSNNVIQHWVPATITPSDADFGSAGTIAATWEDQFGNKMKWVAGLTVGAAA